MVQNTMMDIAMQTRDVLKFPKPDVLFIDHADSALIFRLRVWVNWEYYWSVPSEIRCEIDRRFRQLGIEIAFPQRDLHIRTVPAAIDLPVLAGNSKLAEPVREPIVEHDPVPLKVGSN